MDVLVRERAGLPCLDHRVLGVLEGGFALLRQVRELGANATLQVTRAPTLAVECLDPRVDQVVEATSVGARVCLVYA